jgi:hypothetical protein
MESIVFNGIPLNVVPTGDARKWYMSVEQTAEAYGRTRTTIMEHLRIHADELREGVERGVGISDTLGGAQSTTILYREGVIKLGFFIRSPQAVVFRQFATDLIVQHLKDTNQDSPSAFQTLLESMTSGFKDLNSRFDELACITETVFGDDKGEIQKLVKQVAEVYRVDGRTVWGWIQSDCDVGSYKKQATKVKNYLLVKLGKGVSLAPPENTDDSVKNQGTGF